MHEYNIRGVIRCSKVIGQQLYTSVDTAWSWNCGHEHHMLYAVGMERERMLQYDQTGIKGILHCDREDTRVVWC